MDAIALATVLLSLLGLAAAAIYLPDPPLQENAMNATPSRNPDRPASAAAIATLNRLAERHGRPPAKAGITATEASDAIRWLATRRKAGEEFAPVPEVDPELQPGMTLRHWDTPRPAVRKAGGA